MGADEPLAALPLYCGSCNQVHRFTFVEVERIVYALQADLIDECVDPSGIGRFEDMEPDCLNAVLGGSNDGEMFLEHVSSYVECRTARDAPPCEKDDDDWTVAGAYHHPLCPRFDPTDTFVCDAHEREVQRLKRRNGVGTS